MNDSLSHNHLLTPPAYDESFIRDIETIIFKEKRNIIVKWPHTLMQNITYLKEIYPDIVFVDIDIYIGEERKDFIEQVVRIIKDQFHGEISIKEKYELLNNEKISPTLIDDILYSIFDELTCKFRIVLIFEKFDRYSLELGDDHYHRLLQLCKKRCFEKVNFILIIENSQKIQPKSYMMNDFLSTFDCQNLPSLSSMPSSKIIYKPINEKVMDKPEVYISYAWEDESEKIVNKICTTLETKNIKYERDKKNIEYKGSIKAFENRLGKGDFIILVISDKFLRSKDCMYEVLRIKEHGNMSFRILPIVLSSAKIHRSVDRIQYIEHWEKEIEMLDAGMKRVNSANLVGVRDDIDNFTKFRAIIDEIITLLSDMNTLSRSIHENNNYSDILKIIEENSIIESISETYDSDSKTKETIDRTISQKGKNAIYIEKNSGNISIQ